MQGNGPPLETLLRRVADTPPAFLDEPRIGAAGTVSVPAVVNDLLARLSQPAALPVLAPFRGTDRGADRNRLMLTLVLCWLLADEAFRGLAPPQPQVVSLLDDTARELAAHASALKYIEDPDRREELVRTALARLDLRPEGETPAQATDRLSALSAVERRRLLDASRAAEARAREIRAALVRKQAEDSADKWTRE